MNINLENNKKNKKEMDPQELRYRRRKDIIKNVAIIFLAVMLVLTFFSNTIMNYSLPRVAVQYMESGSITSSIRGTGMVECGDPYNVMVKETRTVSSITCRVGNVVNKGDLLFSLAQEDSSELEAAKEELKVAQAAYDDLILSMDITASIIASSQGNISVNEYRAKITAAQTAVEEAQKEVDAATAELESLNNQIDIARAAYVSEADKAKLSVAEDKKDAAKDAWDNCGYVGNIEEDYKNAEKALTDAKNVEDAAKKAYENACSDYDAKQSAIDSAQQTVDTMAAAGAVDGDPDYENAKAALTEAQNARNNAATVKADADTAYTNAKADTISAAGSFDLIRNSNEYALYTAYKSAEKEYNDLNTSINNRVNSNSDTISALEAQKAAVQVKLNKATSKLEEKNSELGDLIGDIGFIRSLNKAHQDIVEAQKKVEKLSSSASAMDIEAPINGTILSINIVSGKQTDPSLAAVVIQPEGQSYTMSFSVTNDEAKKISIGAQASVTNSWWYNDVTGTVASIRPDTSAPNTNKLVTLNLNGSLVDGQTLTMSIDTHTANYDCIVPNSAIHEDNNGKFILIVESKSSPLGNRYFAVRYDIQVLASDDTKSAVKAGLEGYEYVITTSSKPISAGDQVRLAEN